MAALVDPSSQLPAPHELVERSGTPDTIPEWKALVEGLLTDDLCVFHRNLEISSRYAWMYKSLPCCLKWAGMAAFASHHVRLALYPFRLDTDRTGVADIDRSLGRRRLLIGDVNILRETNNAIFDDIFWVHLAYTSTEGGIERIRALLAPEQRYTPILAGFEAIDRGRQIIAETKASTEARRAAAELIWDGNVQLLEHEQRALVQPHFDRLSCRFARLFSIGSSLNFEVRGPRQEFAYFSAFYVYSFGRGLPQAWRAGTWPRVTRFEDRWRWIRSSIVPRFRRFDADVPLIHASLQRILDEARTSRSAPCGAPRHSVGADQGTRQNRLAFTAPGQRSSQELSGRNPPTGRRAAGTTPASKE